MLKYYLKEIGRKILGWISWISRGSTCQLLSKQYQTFEFHI